MPEKTLRHAEFGASRRVVRLVSGEKALSARFVLDSDAMGLIYPSGIRKQIEALVDVSGPPLTSGQVSRDPSLLEGVEVLFSGWGAPKLTESLLNAAQSLKVVFYGAGDTRSFFTNEARLRGVQVTSCNAANAVPVAEYTMAQIVMCLKRIWQNAFKLRRDRVWSREGAGATCYGSTVGVVSLGDIGRLVVERLARMDVEVLAYDIQRDGEFRGRHGFRYANLETIFRECDVVSLHTPLMPETTGMIGRDLLASMKRGASLINTSRGGIIDQAALVDVLRKRADLFAVLDVVNPEPPAPDCPIWDLPNAVLTPHIAGSLGRECQRMGQWVINDLQRYLRGEAMAGAVS